LLRPAQRVPDDPFFRDLAVDDAEDVDAGMSMARSVAGEKRSAAD
jgi:hypothetical protein